jgi:Transcriptional regulators
MEAVPLIKEVLVEKLRSEIIKKRSDCLVKIDSERSLSETLGVSRSSLRAAIDELANEGLLLKIQGKGTYITPDVACANIHLACPKDLKYNDPFYIKFIVEITSLTARRGISLKVLDPEHLVDSPDDTPLIISGQLDESSVRKLKSIYSKIVAIEDYPENEGLHQVIFDDYKIGCDAATMLYQLNHKNVLLLAGPEKYPSAFKRKNGFLYSANNLGIQTKVIHTKMNWSGGTNVAKEVAEAIKTSSCTAAFCSNDWMAAGLIQGLKECDVSVPGDISIIGCDNIPLSSELKPAISTFDLDMKLLVEEVFEEINNLKTPKKLLIPASFISRDSIKQI